MGAILLMHLTIEVPRGVILTPPRFFFSSEKKTARCSKNSLGIIILKSIPRVLAKTAIKISINVGVAPSERRLSPVIFVPIP